MRRFITYLYDYEGGTKGKGTGFVRVDVRGREVRMDVHVRNANHFQGKGKLYLIVKSDSVVGLYVGDITIISGNGDESLRFLDADMYNSGMDFSDVIGIGIHYTDGYLASNWQEENCPQLIRGTFKVVSLQENEEVPELEEVPEREEMLVLEEVPEREEMPKREEVPAYTEEPTYRKIQLSHIRSLPSKNRYLCNNSFLLHGFFNYNYLILKKEKTDDKEKWSLGVPGVYEQPERMMAMMFGFSRFEPQDKDVEHPTEGTFGAWFIALEM